MIEEHAMSEKKLKQTGEAATDESRINLKKALIALAIIEALVLIPTILHLILR